MTYRIKWEVGKGGLFIIQSGMLKIVNSRLIICQERLCQNCSTCAGFSWLITFLIPLRNYLDRVFVIYMIYWYKFSLLFIISCFKTSEKHGPSPVNSWCVYGETEINQSVEL